MHVPPFAVIPEEAQFAFLLDLLRALRRSPTKRVVDELPVSARCLYEQMYNFGACPCPPSAHPPPLHPTRIDGRVRCL